MASTSENSLSISDNAAKRIAVLMEQEGKTDAKLRISVQGGGCSGFQYKYDFDDTQNDDDIVIEKDGVQVMIDVMSLGYVSGSELDYIENLGGSFFEIKNPNATASCGCGNSFSV